MSRMNRTFDRASLDPRPDPPSAQRPRRPSSSDRSALAVVLLLAGATLALAPGSLRAQGGHGHSHGPGDGHDHEGFHFTHPMIAESVSPDTKIRLDHQLFEFPDGDTEHSGVLEAEYAVTPGFSVEAGIPYSYSAGAFGDAELLLKFTNRALEASGVLLGYGIGLGLPTSGGSAQDGGHGDGHHGARVPSSMTPEGPVRFHTSSGGVKASLGSENWELQPFLNVGVQTGRLELVGWGLFGVPFGPEARSGVSTEVGWNVSALLHASDRVQPLLELDGSSAVNGPEVGEDVVHLSPGLRVRPFGDRRLWLGTSVSFPMASGAEQEPFDLRWQTSLFWHFF